MKSSLTLLWNFSASKAGNTIRYLDLKIWNSFKLEGGFFWSEKWHERVKFHMTSSFFLCAFSYINIYIYRYYCKYLNHESKYMNESSMLHLWIFLFNDLMLLLDAAHALTISLEHKGSLFWKKKQKAHRFSVSVFVQGVKMWTLISLTSCRHCNDFNHLLTKLLYRPQIADVDDARRACTGLQS